LPLAYKPAIEFFLSLNLKSFKSAFITLKPLNTLGSFLFLNTAEMLPPLFKMSKASVLLSSFKL